MSTLFLFDRIQKYILLRFVFFYSDLPVFFVRLSLDNYFPQRNNAGY